MSTETKVLIGVRGALQAGKDTIGQYLINDLSDRGINIQRRSFAQNLKEATALVFGFDPEYVFTEQFKLDDTHVTRLETPGEAGTEKLTGRQVLQFFGSEICRSMDHNCWARGPVNHFKQNGVTVGLVTDLRFPNEIRVLRDEQVPSFIIKVERPGYTGDGHVSERALDNYDGDDFVVINDGTLEDLERATKEIAKQIVERVNL